MKKLFFGENRFLMKELTNANELRQEMQDLDQESIADEVFKERLDQLQQEIAVEGQNSEDYGKVFEKYKANPEKYKMERAALAQPNLQGQPSVPTVAPAVAPVKPAVPEAIKPAENLINTKSFPELNLDFEISDSFPILSKESFKNEQVEISDKLKVEIKKNPDLKKQIEAQLKSLKDSLNPTVKEFAQGLLENEGLNIEAFAIAYSQFLVLKIEDKFEKNYPDAFKDPNVLKSGVKLEYEIKASGGVPEVTIQMPPEFEKEYREDGTEDEGSAEAELDKKATSMMKNPILGAVFGIFGKDKEKVKDMLKDGGGWFFTLLAGALGVAGFKSGFDTFMSALPDKFKKPFEKFTNAINKRANKYLVDKAKKYSPEAFGTNIGKGELIAGKNGIALTKAFDLQNNTGFNWVTVTVPEDGSVNFSPSVHGAYILEGGKDGTPLEEKKVNSLSSEGTTTTYRLQLKEIPAGTFFSKGVKIAQGDMDKTIKYDLPQDEGAESEASAEVAAEDKAKDDVSSEDAGAPKEENPTA